MLLAATVAVFLPLGGNDFINFDDPVYVTDNPVVGAGLTLPGLRWACTSVGYASNWHPLTWLSHMLDVSLFGMSPGKQHLMSLLYHLATTAAVFLALKGMTGVAWPSAFAAALFAIHPLHVESVAWIAERKDVLCALFWVLALSAYTSWVRRRTPLRQAAVVLCFALALLAKPVAMTLPFVLLLLDYWPFGRFRADGAAAPKHSGAVPAAGRLLTEKVPFFALSVASGLVTLLAQRQGGAVSSLEEFPFMVRVDNAILAAVRYLGKTLWPEDLAVFYPHAGVRLPVWEVAGAGAILIGISILALRWRRRCPSLGVGWFWYLVTLAPVLGLVHVGSQAMADRYTYLSLIGVFVAFSWGVRVLASRRSGGGIVVVVAATALLVLAAGVARRQVGYWEDSVSLYRHALEVTESNWLVNNNLGMAYLQLDDYNRALAHFTEALSISPSYEQARRNRDYTLVLQRVAAAGDAGVQGVVAAGRRLARERLALGNALGRQGRLDEAAQRFREAVDLDPGLAEAFNNLGGALLSQGRLEESARSFEKAVALEPGNAAVHFNLGVVLEALGKTAEAGRQYREASNLKPGEPRFRDKLAAFEKPGSAPGVPVHR